MKISLNYDTVSKEWSVDGLDIDKEKIKCISLYVYEDEPRLCIDSMEENEEEGYKRVTYTVASKGLIPQEDDLATKIANIFGV